MKQLRLVTKFMQAIPPQEEVLDIIKGEHFGDYETNPRQLLMFADLV